MDYCSPDFLQTVNVLFAGAATIFIVGVFLFSKKARKWLAADNKPGPSPKGLLVALPWLAAVILIAGAFEVLCP